MTCHAKPGDVQHSLRPEAVWRSRKEPRGTFWYAYCEECAKDLPPLPLAEDKGRAAWEKGTDWSYDGTHYYYCGVQDTFREYDSNVSVRKKR